MARVPFAIQSYRHRSLPVSAQRLLNWFPEAEVAEASARVVLLPTPGLVVFAALPSGPVRGLHVMGDTLYAVANTQVYRVGSDGLFSNAGDIVGFGPVLMADNGTQVVIVDPASTRAWVVTPSTLQEITDTDFDGAISVDVVDGYAVFAKPNSTELFVSAINDALSYDALDFASAEGSPDNIVSARRVSNRLWIFGEKTTEIWSNVGGDFPFLRASGGFFDRGCGAAFSVAVGGESVFWLGEDRVVYAGEGFKPRRISTHAMEQAVAGYASVFDARGWFYEQEGHQFYVLSFPGAGETWVYDLLTGAWHERESEGYDTWRCGCGVAFATGVIGGDTTNGNLYRVDTVLYDEAGTEIRRSATGTTFHAEGRTLRHVRLDADMETGTGLSSGQGQQPKVWLQFSDDSGRTWGNELWSDLGAQGDYLMRCTWNQLGAARNRVYRLSMSDPVRTALIAANLDVEAGAA